MKPFDGNYGKAFNFEGLGDLPARVGISGCLYGQLCNYRGEENPFESVRSLRERAGEQIHWVPFCPEDASMGTPREPMNIVGGSGVDVLSGSAKVLTHSGTDVTAEMLDGAQKMLKLCKSENVQLAMLMEGSPSCGSHWVFDGATWPEKTLVAGLGVTAAVLESEGIQVMSPLDEQAIESLMNWVERSSIPR